MATSTTDPITEEGPDPDDGTVADPPGPDRIGLIIINACCNNMHHSQAFPDTGRHRIPSGAPVTVVTTESVHHLKMVPDLDEFHMWYNGMQHGTIHLHKYSIHTKEEALVSKKQLEKVQFISKTNFFPNLPKRQPL